MVAMMKSEFKLQIPSCAILWKVVIVWNFCQGSSSRGSNRVQTAPRQTFNPKVKTWFRQTHKKVFLIVWGWIFTTRHNILKNFQEGPKKYLILIWRWFQFFLHTPIMITSPADLLVSFLFYVCPLCETIWTQGMAWKQQVGRNSDNFEQRNLHRMVHTTQFVSSLGKMLTSS